MFDIWARLRATHKDIKVGVVYSENMFHTEVDKLDHEKYESVTIIKSNDYLSPPVYYEEFKISKVLVRRLKK